MSSPASIASSLLAPAWGKSALFIGSFFIASWAVAIIYWRVTDHMPGTGELAACLVGVPLLLSGGLWLSRRLVPHPAGPEAAASAPVHGPATVAASAATLAILNGALRVRCGSAADEVLAAIIANKARPDLDPHLRDDDGFPLMTSRCDAADDDALREEIEAWMRANGGVTFLEEQWRALILATHVVGELIAATDAPAPLHLLPLLPDDWSAGQRDGAGNWLTHAITTAGWPAGQVKLAPAIPPKTTLAAVLNALHAERDSPRLTMIVAFASNIGDHTVASWADEKMLFTSSSPNGMIPGEGAAAVLLSDTGVGNYARLSPIEERPRENAAGQARRSDPTLLADVALRALAHAGVQPADIAMVVSGTGHEARDVLEVAGLATRLGSHLDSSEDVVRTGVATGSSGVVPTLAAMVVARHVAIERQRPLLWVSNEDRHGRAAAVICAPAPHT